MAFFCYLLTLALRFDGSVPDRYWSSFWRFLPIALAIHLVVNQLSGLYGQMWRYASVQEARRIVLAGCAGAVAVVNASVLVGLATDGLRALPLSVTIFGAVLTLLGTGAVRFQSQLFSTRRPVRDTERRRVLIVGAGAAGSMILKDLLRSPSLGLHPVGLIDDDRRKVGRRLHGVPVHGPIAAIPRLVKELEADVVLLAIPSATSELVREVAAACERAHAMLKVLPSVHETVGGKVTARDIRDLQIEDLLGRQQVDTDLDAVKALLRGRRVLITGAGGSIGSEIARQVASFGPASLVLLDHDETHLHDVVMSLDEFAEELTEATGVVDLATAEMQLETCWPTSATASACRRVRAAPARDRVPRRRPQARADPRGAPRGGADHQRPRHRQPGRRRRGQRGRALRAHLHRQGRPPGQRDGRLEVARRAGRAQPPERPLGAVRGALRQRARQPGQRGPDVHAPDRPRRAGHRHRRPHDPVLHERPRGGPARAPGGGPVHRRRGVHARDGRAGPHPRPGPADDPALGPVPGRDMPIEITGVRPGEKLTEEIVAPDEEQVPSGHPAIVVSRPPVPDRAVVHRTLADFKYLSFEGRAWPAA